MSAAPEERLAHLAVELSKLLRIQLVARGARVRVERLPVVRERLRVRCDRAGVVARTEEKRLGPRPVLRLGVVERDCARQLVEMVGKDVLEHVGDATVQLAPFRPEDVLVHDLLRDRVLEGVLALAVAPKLADELGLRELVQRVASLLLGHELDEQPIREAPAEYGRDAEDVRRVASQAVDARDDRAVEGVRDSEVLRMVLVLAHRLHDLLDEEGVALGRLDDPRTQGGGQGTAVGQVYHELVGGGRGERLQLEVDDLLPQPGLCGAAPKRRHRTRLCARRAPEKHGFGRGER